MKPWGLIVDEIINGPVGNNREQWYEIEWYDDSYSGCWRFHNKFKSLSEAREFITSGKVISGKKLRIVYKTFEIIENY